MAVMQNSIIFGGIDSADFGIYIGGEGTFNAPKRDVEMISIPGRNGAFALDKGRFENIEVTYSAFNHEPDLATFSAQLEGFRNAICSQKGYQRLTDTFHPDEYRMAAYIDGLEIKPIEYNTAATFDIKFDCMPQRFLTSGEEAIDVDSGDTVTNPTRFESSPMLEVEGYGIIGFNGYEIELDDAFIGEITLANSTAFSAKNKTISLDTALLNNGDTITVSEIRLALYVKMSSWTDEENTSVSDSSQSFASTWNGVIRVNPGRWKSIRVDTVLPSFSFTKGNTATYTDTVTINLKDQNGSFTATCDITVMASADAISITRVTSSSAQNRYTNSATNFTSFVGEVVGDSTQTYLGEPTIIDCDLGAAYRVDDGVVTSLNQYIDLGSNLPTLAPGENAIAYDATVTDLKITPRWWRI